MKEITRAEPENLYRTVYELQGIKHPVETPAALDAAGDDIAARMRACGFRVREQAFTIEGWDAPFRNIEGSIGPVGERPAAVLMAHYDTVATTLGANDDAAGVAIILEAGRVLAQMADPPPVYIVAVALEESSNPTIYARERESALRNGVVDERHMYRSWACAKLKPKLDQRARQIMETGKTQGEGYRLALEELGDTVPANLRKHIGEIIPLYAEVTVESSIGLRSRIGSHRWVQEAIATGKKIAFNITVDEPGIYRYGPRTQGLLGGMGFEVFTHQYRLDPENAVGNFVMLVTNAGSSKVGAVYAEHCEDQTIDIPYGWADVPLTFEQVVQYQPMGLNSDHACFWQAGIPALFVFDSSTARDPYGHTMTDKVDNLDYDRMAEITQAIVATLLDERVYGI
jgi:hypothetical protein